MHDHTPDQHSSEVRPPDMHDLHTQPRQTVWLRTPELGQRLRVGRSQLWQLRRDLLLREGVHYRRSGRNGGGPVLWDLFATETALRQVRPKHH